MIDLHSHGARSDSPASALYERRAAGTDRRRLAGRVVVLLVVALLAAVLGPQASAAVPSGVLFESNYDAVGPGSSVRGTWQVEQEPASPGASGPVQTSRISVAARPPGTGAAKPAGNALRVELRPFETSPGAANGDVTNTGGYLANRAEVYARHAVPGSSPASAWPDPAGAVRWYAFSLLVPIGQTFATDTTWMTVAQWKGRDGPGPPIALEVKRNHLRLGGTRGNAGAFPSDGDLGAVVPGTWTRIVVGMRISPNPTLGWVETWRDGRQVVPRTAVATMDRLKDGVTPDPIYFKEGVYRSTAWRTTQVLWFGPTRIGFTQAAVG